MLKAHQEGIKEGPRAAFLMSPWMDPLDLKGLVEDPLQKNFVDVWGPELGQSFSYGYLYGEWLKPRKLDNTIVGKIETRSKEIDLMIAPSRAPAQLLSQEFPDTIIYIGEVQYLLIMMFSNVATVQYCHS